MAHSLEGIAEQRHPIFANLGPRRNYTEYSLSDILSTVRARHSYHLRRVLQLLTPNRLARTRRDDSDSLCSILNCAESSGSDTTLRKGSKAACEPCLPKANAAFPRFHAGAVESSKRDITEVS